MATADPKGRRGGSDECGNFSGGRLRPYHNRVSDYVGAQFSSLPKVLLSVLVWYYTVDMHAAAEGWDFSPQGWVMRVLLRDLVLMVLVAGVWDYVLYFSPLKDRMKAYKFNKRYPSGAQFRRDIFWTTSATLLAAAQEVLLMRWWAGGHFKAALFGWPAEGGEEAFVPWDLPFFGSEENHTFAIPLPSAITEPLSLPHGIYFHAYTAGFLLWTMTMYYWRIAHFWIVHRAMHPWWDRKNGLKDGDIGAFLYRHIHAHHHKSYNCTAWSGLSMTPGESITYMSAAFIPLLFRSGCHPWIHLYTKIDLIVGAQIAHDGFDAPGGGAYFHQLHHAHYECNYGDPACPLDWLFNTFEDGTKWAEENRKALREKAKKGNLDPSVADAAEKLD